MCRRDRADLYSLRSSCTLSLRSGARINLYSPSLSGTLALHHMSSVIDRLNDMPPLPQRTPAPRHTGRYVLLLVIILLVANAIVGERGLVALFRANQAHASQQLIINALHAENGRLRRYAQALAADPRVIAEVARRELGLLKPGEQLFILRDTEGAPPPTSPDAAREPAPSTP